MDAELVFRAQQLQQNIESTEESLRLVDSQIMELEHFIDNIKALYSKESESFSSLGKGVFVKSTTKNSELLVEVGAGVLVKKSLDETIQITESQIARFKEVKLQMRSYLESYQQDLEDVISKIKSLENK